MARQTVEMTINSTTTDDINFDNATANLQNMNMTAHTWESATAADDKKSDIGSIRFTITTTWVCIAFA